MHVTLLRFHANWIWKKKNLRIEIKTSWQFKKINENKCTSHETVIRQFLFVFFPRCSVHLLHFNHNLHLNRATGLRCNNETHFLRFRSISITINLTKKFDNTCLSRGKLALLLWLPIFSACSLVVVDVVVLSFLHHNIKILNFLGHLISNAHFPCFLVSPCVYT